MNKKPLLVLLPALIYAAAATAEKDLDPPRVVATFPLNQSTDVDPTLKAISVTFNEPMMDGSWSWVYEDKTTFPQILAQPYYTENKTKNMLPVKLEPNKEYVIWINSTGYENFKDQSGNSAFPFKFTFTTK